MAKRGWMIIEMILTLAIVGVLLALVLPGLGRVRGQARLTSCSANLRSLLLATLMYTDGPGRGSFPVVRTSGFKFWPEPEGFARLGQVLREPLEAIAPFLDTPLPDPQQPDRHAPFACPSDQKWAPYYGISYAFVPASLSHDTDKPFADPGTVRSVTLAYENRLPFYDPVWWDFDPTTHRAIAPHGLSGRNFIRYDGGVAWRNRRLADEAGWLDLQPPP